MRTKPGFSICWSMEFDNCNLALACILEFVICLEFVILEFGAYPYVDYLYPPFLVYHETTIVFFSLPVVGKL